MERILREPEVRDVVGVSASTLYAWEKSGLFPPRQKIGPRAVGWHESVIEAWLEERKAA
jgi:prophage regulatory protein|tara:strand:+ start:248 stop:424 length:177 start_codon:yes stop_codon:yes gene_type:complete